MMTIPEIDREIDALRQAMEDMEYAYDRLFTDPGPRARYEGLNTRMNALRRQRDTLLKG